MQEKQCPVSDSLIISIFQAAMSRPQNERQPFLREACRDNPELLREAARRVDWEQRLNGFMATPLFPRDRLDQPFSPEDTVMDRFKILRVAGEGGMAVVYEADDLVEGDRVALKCPRFEFRRRLAREARSSHSVAHYNVCNARGIHTAPSPSGEVHLLAMEFLDGETLAARLPRAPRRWLSTAAGAGIAQQICAGLQAVHENNVIHRDLKPNNVMLSTGAGGKTRAVIMDFGISHAADIFSSHAGGTPAYIAPEIWRGEPATVQSDLFSLGVMFYEMASGRKPFPDDVEWSRRFRTKPEPPDVAEPMRSAILRCLEPAPGQRFASVADFRAAAWNSRRKFFLAALTAAGGFALAAGVNRHFHSPIRLVVLPPSTPNEDPLLGMFLHDVTSAFKTLSARRPLNVTPHALAAANRASGPGQAKEKLGATHALSTAFLPTVSGWIIDAALIDTFDYHSILRWQRQASAASLPAGLFALRAAIAADVNAALFLGAGPLRQTLTPEAYADYAKGFQYVRSDPQDLPKAVYHFEQVVRAAPESAFGYAGLAEALLESRYDTGDLALEGRAVAALSRAEALDPDLAHVQIMSARLNASAGNWERAVAHSQRAAALAPNTAEPFIQLATAHYMLHQAPLAEAAVLGAIAAEPHAYSPYFAAGLLHYELRQFSQAEKYWLEAIRLGPSDTRARASLAQIYIGTARFDAAAKLIGESLDRKRTQAALAAKAALLEYSGQLKEAVAVYEEAIAIGPATYKIWAKLGGACRRAGMPAPAAHAFSSGLKNAIRGLQNHSREAERTAWAALYHAQLGQEKEARAAAANALALAQPPLPATRGLLVLTYGHINDIEQSLQLLNGAPPDLLEELARGLDFPPALRRDSRLARFIQ